MATATSMRPSGLARARAAEMFGAVLLRLPVHARGALVIYLHAIHAHVALPRFRIARDHQRPGDESPGILRPALQDGKFEKRESFPGESLLCTGRTSPFFGKNEPSSASFGSILILSSKPCGACMSRNPRMRSATSSTRSTSSARLHAPLAAQHIDQQGKLGALGPLKQQRRPAGARHALGDLGDLQYRIDFRADALEFSLFFQSRDEFAQVPIGQSVLRYRNQKRQTG